MIKMGDTYIANDNDLKDNVKVLLKNVSEDDIKAIAEWVQHNPQATVGDLLDKFPTMEKIKDKMQEKVAAKVKALSPSLSDEDAKAIGIKTILEYQAKKTPQELCSLGQEAYDEYRKQANDGYIQDGHAVTGFLSAFFGPIAGGADAAICVADTTRKDPNESTKDCLQGAAIRAIPGVSALVQGLGILHHGMNGDLCKLGKDIVGDDRDDCTDYTKPIADKIKQQFIKGHDDVAPGTGGMPDKAQLAAKGANKAPAVSSPS